MPARVVGVAHSTGVHSFFSLDVNEFYSFLVSEGTDNQSAEEIEGEISDMLSLHETRAFAVFAEGSADFINQYRWGVPNADWIVACAPEAELAALGIAPFDVGWSEGDEPLDLGAYLLSERS